MHEAIPLPHDYLIQSARCLPDKIALVYQRKRLSYLELDAQSNALAHALIRLGVEPRDRVAIVASASAEMALAFWAVLKANAVAALVHPKVGGVELAAKLDDCAAKVLIVDGVAISSIDLALRNVRAPLRAVIVSGRMKFPPASASLSVTSWDEALAAGVQTKSPPREVIDADLALILYAPGTPRGIMLTHRAMMSATASLCACLGMEEDDILLDAPSRSIDRALYDMIACFRCGARLVLVPPFASRLQLTKTAVEEHVTGVPATTAVLGALADVTPKGAQELSRVRFVSSPGTALTSQQLELLHRLLPQASIYSIYGAMECTHCTCLPPEYIHRKPQSVGAAVPNTEVWLVDDEGARVGPGRAGRLVVRGAGVMAGYWGNPAESARKLRPLPPAGDLALLADREFEMDDEGHLFFRPPHRS